MRKGDERRQEILTVAEKLFCAKGYEATSVQDILDVLHASKGGFYHHFASKEEVLKTLCVQRAGRAAQHTADVLDGLSGEMKRINAVLHGFMPLRREEVPFVNMLLPMLDKPEGRALALVYQDALCEVFLPLLERETDDAALTGVVCPPVRDMASVILHIVNRCWLDVAMYLIQATRQALRYDTAAMLGILEKYRRAVEVLLDAPYGSVEIIRVEEWEEVAQRLMRTLQLGE
ncbi:MAG: TetR/AcrR family transcriptional regulator [Clostridia bacterium]|nr:TetR/AcrR family transcriptional regulator [Clostridia bacterium]